MRQSIAGMMFAVAISAFGCWWLLGLGPVGREILGLVLGFFLILPAPAVLFVVFLVLLEDAGYLTRPLFTLPLLSLSVFGWPALTVGVFTPGVDYSKLFLTCLALGFGFGLCTMLPYFHDLKQTWTRTGVDSDGKSGWLNAGLAISLMVMLIGWQGVSRAR